MGRWRASPPEPAREFALLPPQNATGNFTKIVQRVPVRIHVDAGEEARKVLVPGLSVTVKVDTRSGRDARPSASPRRTAMAEAGGGTQSLRRATGSRLRPDRSAR